ncbi:sulfatase-like hydrolase/transferase [Anaeromyxobacter oryzae]|nr:sulfatase-like hydrolase/transferase [Anaeromyxobacter oryzae]
MPVPCPPPDAVVHRRALLALALWSAAAALPVAEGYARAADAPGLLSATFVRVAAGAQVLAACIAVALVLLPLTLAAAARAALRVAAPVAFASLHLALQVDRKVYALFHFHVNRMVVDLLLTPGGLASLELTRKDVTLAAAACAAALGLAAAAHAALLRRAARRPHDGAERIAWRRALAATLALLVADRGVYAAADVAARSDVARAATAVPAYGPLPVRQLWRVLTGAGGAHHPLDLLDRSRPGVGEPRYPLAPLRFRAGAPTPPIVWIVLESWRADALDDETTPVIARFARESTWFRRHASGGNSTGFGVFSMFYGIHGVYLDAFAAARQPPALLAALRARGYAFGVFSSAVLTYPALRSTVFAEVPGSIADAFEGDGAMRDRAAAAAAIAFARERASGTAPFLLALFLDSSHAPYAFPPGDAPFAPYAPNLAVAEMGSTAPVLMRNRYRNALRYEDRLVGEVLAALGPRAGEAIVVITGDHGEAFGEGGHWFHNSGFGEEQWHVPLVLRIPGRGPGVRDDLTRHVDLAPTLVEVLGGEDPAADRALGRSLLEPPEHGRHAVVCGWAACAIIEDDDTTTVFANGIDESTRLTAHGPRYEPRDPSAAPRLLMGILDEMRRFVR